MLKESEIEDVDLQGIADEIGAELDQEKLRFSYPKLNFHLNLVEFLDEVEGEGETIVGDWEEGHLYYVQVAAVFEDGTDLLVFSQDVRAAILHCLKVALAVCSGHSEEEELYQQNPNLRELLSQA